ncbi:MAG TPA: hypothetical protein VJ692_07215 [Nitrospiraceae bacterium]|nr:hypothetical protein [Nitrospiraceae bacterium]
MWHVEAGRSALVPVPSGRAYRIDSPAANALVTPELAEELGRTLERFAVEAGFSAEHPVGLIFKPGVVGHHKVGRAADIYQVRGVGLDQWKARWDRVQAAKGTFGRLDNANGSEHRYNLGWRLYKALQCYGRWAQPYGYSIQLFGPWTRTEGPWKYISDRLLDAHRDHIHVAK